MCVVEDLAAVTVRRICTCCLLLTEAPLVVAASKLMQQVYLELCFLVQQVDAELCFGVQQVDMVVIQCCDDVSVYWFENFGAVAHHHSHNHHLLQHRVQLHHHCLFGHAVQT